MVGVSPFDACFICVNFSTRKLQSSYYVSRVAKLLVWNNALLVSDWYLDGCFLKFSGLTCIRSFYPAFSFIFILLAGFHAFSLAELSVITTLVNCFYFLIVWSFLLAEHYETVRLVTRARKYSHIYSFQCKHDLGHYGIDWIKVEFTCDW